jgi:hypothetical protein
MRKLTRICLNVSFDGGKTFRGPRPLIQKGFNETDWARGVSYGENSIAVSFARMTKAGDKLILPVSAVSKDADFSRPFNIQIHSGCFTGKWKGDDIEWELGEFCGIRPDVSSRGFCEPAIELLKNGKLIMILRGSNTGMTDKPGRKWFCLSDDMGMTWTEVKELKYDDGGSFFSPATGSMVLRHSVNGKLYWFGNIVPENPDGNRPRYPLQIAELDEDIPAIKKNSVFVIEDKQPEDNPLVQFSNFKVYEDMETHEFVLIMARLQERGEEMSGRPLWEYRISVD